jgi:AraC family transcriptional regulator
MPNPLPPALRGPEDAAGKVPKPLSSSLSRHWNGILVEHYRARNGDMVRETSAHVVTVFLGGPVVLVQARYGRVLQRAMHTGEIIVAPAGGPKELRHKGEAEVLKLWLDAEFFARIVADVAATNSGRIELLDNFGTQDFDVESIARRLHHEAQADTFGSRLYAETLATELTVHLLRRYSTANLLPTRVVTTLPKFKVQRVADYINDNLAEDLPLERLSAMVHMSPWHFAHAFKRTTGLAPHRFLLRCRIERAKSLLRETNLPISEVAHQVGYPHQSNFSVAFRRITGHSPREFRNQA